MTGDLKLSQENPSSTRETVMPHTSPQFHELPPHAPSGVITYLKLPNQAAAIELPDAFSGLNVRLIQTICAQHGEFLTRSKKGKFETVVDIGGHVSHRYLVDRAELTKVQDLHREIVRWWLSQEGI
jgi:hypothetical protein